LPGPARTTNGSRICTPKRRHSNNGKVYSRRKERRKEKRQLLGKKFKGLLSVLSIKMKLKYVLKLSYESFSLRYLTVYNYCTFFSKKQILCYFVSRGKRKSFLLSIMCKAKTSSVNSSAIGRGCQLPSIPRISTGDVIGRRLSLFLSLSLYFSLSLSHSLWLRNKQSIEGVERGRESKNTFSWNPDIKGKVATRFLYLVNCSFETIFACQKVKKLSFLKNYNIRISLFLTYKDYTF